MNTQNTKKPIKTISLWKSTLVLPAMLAVLFPIPGKAEPIEERALVTSRDPHSVLAKSWIIAIVSNKRPNAAPTDLIAKSASRLPDPDISGSGFTGVAISWVDNSNNEDGFIISRSQPGGSMAVVARVKRDTRVYMDPLPAPASPYDQYCYAVTAYTTLNV